MPDCTTFPPSRTRIRSAPSIVESRCAITRLVLPASASSRAALHEALVLGVEVAGRLVEDHDRGVLEQHPCDCDALLLSAREPVSALTDDRLEPVGERVDEVEYLRATARGAGPRSWHPGA